MAVNTEVSTENRNVDHVPTGAAALAQEYARSLGPSDLSVAERSKIMVGAAAEGTFTHAADEIINHPGRTASQVLGAAALGLALHGPVWTRLPALAIAAVGTVSYAQSLAQAESSAASTFSGLNSGNIEKSREEFKASLSPVIFDTALMFGAGAAASHFAPQLPLEAPKLELASTLALTRDHLSNLLGDGGFPPGLTPATAGAHGFGFGAGALRGGKGLFEPVGETRPQRLIDFLNAGKAPEQAQIMAMSNESNLGGSRISGDGIQFKASRGLNGETFYTVDNIPSGRSVNVTHDGTAVTSVGSDGKVMVGFNSGEGRQLDLGQKINRLVMIEHASGLKQFHFNSKHFADLEVDANKHTIRALLGNGDHLHMMDNTPNGYTHFTHKDGLQTWVEHGGRVVVQLPNNVVREVSIPNKLAYIRMLEKADGGKQFRFLDDAGQPVAQKVELPPTPELQAAKAPDEVKNWHDLRNYISSRQAAQQTLHQQDLSQQGGGGGVYRVDPSPGGVFHAQNHHTPDQFGRMMRIQPSLERTMAHELVGIPYNIMRGDDLATPAAMGLAMQDHGWVITSYLDRLDHQDDIVGHHDWY